LQWKGEVEDLADELHGNASGPAGEVELKEWERLMHPVCKRRIGEKLNPKFKKGQCVRVKAAKEGATSAYEALFELTVPKSATLAEAARMVCAGFKDGMTGPRRGCKCRPRSCYKILSKPSWKPFTHSGCFKNLHDFKDFQAALDKSTFKKFTRFNGLRRRKTSFGAIGQYTLQVLEQMKTKDPEIGEDWSKHDTYRHFMLGCTGDELHQCGCNYGRIASPDILQQGSTMARKCYRNKKECMQECAAVCNWWKKKDGKDRAEPLCRRGHKSTCEFEESPWNNTIKEVR
jgi:hypothetical protein